MCPSGQGTMMSTEINHLVFLATFQRGMYEPSEEFHLVHEQQQADDHHGVQDDEREGCGQVEIMDIGIGDGVDAVLMVKIIEQAVEADKTQQLVIRGQVEHQQRHENGAGEDHGLLRQTLDAVVVCSVHDVAAVGEEPEDERQQHDDNGDVQFVVLPQLLADEPLTVVIAYQEENVEVERSPERQVGWKVYHSPQQRHGKGDAQVQRGPAKQRLGRIIQYDAPPDQADQVPQDTVGEF